MKSFLKKKITYKQMSMNSDSYLIECPICFNESYDIHICNKCYEAWCLNCHNKLLQSKLIKKEEGQYYYYCPIMWRKIYLSNKEIKKKEGSFYSFFKFL